MPTPFGIRRRVKRFFGIQVDAQATEPEVEKAHFTITGPKGEQAADVAVGVSLLAASGATSHPIASGCSDSSCGTCRVEILQGADLCTEQVARERATLKENGFPTALRLACKTDILKAGDIKVRAYEVT